MGVSRPLSALELIFVMGFLDLLFHLGNLLAPALGVGVLGAVLVKGIWRRALSRVALGRLTRWAVLAGGVGLFTGLLLTGRDGRMAVHAATVAGVALGLWWAAFVRPAGR
jgi:hypothetical protein